MKKCRKIIVGFVLFVLLGGCQNAGNPMLQNNLVKATEVAQDGIQHTGYSMRFQPIKKALINGQQDSVNSLFQKHLGIEKFNMFDPEGSDLDLLKMTELADLYLIQGNTEKAIKSVDIITQILAEKEDESILVSGGKGGVGWLCKNTWGNAEDCDQYHFEDFEKIALYNLKSLAYLLNGDRKSYNVARHSIDRQNELREKFGQELAESKKQLSLFQSNLEKKAEADDTQSSGLMDVPNTADRYAVLRGYLNLANTLDNYFLRVDKKGSQLPSAYVNPFADYMHGIIQEFDSFKKPMLRPNARKSYEKALSLNPGSSAIKAAVKATKSRRRIPSRKKLVHIIVAEGFSPEKKTLQHSLPAGDFVMPLRVPMYEPDPLPLARRIDIRTANNKHRLGRLSVISNIDNLSLRAQKDRRTEDLLDLGATVARTFFESEMLSSLGLGGQFLQNLRSNTTSLDTRSWLSLPSAISATRLVVSKSTKRVRFVVYDKKFRRKINKVISLPAGHGVVYVRVIGDSLYVHSSAKMWMDS